MGSLALMPADLRGQAPKPTQGSPTRSTSSSSEKPVRIVGPFVSRDDQDEYTKVVLKNGLTLVVVEDNRLPLVSYRLAFPVGGAFDPPDLPGLTDLLAGLLPEGTVSRTSKEIADEVARMGASISAGANSDSTIVAASALATFNDPILDLMAEIVLEPSFPENEVELAVLRPPALDVQVVTNGGIHRTNHGFDLSLAPRRKSVAQFGESARIDARCVHQKHSSQLELVPSSTLRLFRGLVCRRG